MSTPAPDANVPSFVGSVLRGAHLEEFLSLLPELTSDLEEIDRVVQGTLPCSYPFLSEAAAYATAAGGKRVRPLFMAVAHRALGATSVDAVAPLAAAFQLIHTATLVHDDVIDHAELRRGKPSVPRAFGPPGALVTGDYLFVRAFQLAARYPAPIILRCGDACAELAQGEIMQENSRFDLTLGRERYLRIVALKTASIVAAGLASVGMVRGGSATLNDGLATYGLAVGVAFQLQDDLLDVYGDPDVTGKPLFSDLREGIPTLLSLDTHSSLEGRERTEFERLFSQRRKGPADLLRLKELTDATPARRRSEEEAHLRVEEGIRALDGVPPGPYRRLLERMAQGVVARRF